MNQGRLDFQSSALNHSATPPRTSVTNNFLFIAAEYKVEVTTGVKDGAGTDANVFITIYGSNGQSMEKKLKGKFFENNFEKGK